MARYCAGQGLLWFAVTLRLAGQGLGWAVPAYLALAFVCLVLAVIDAATGLLVTWNVIAGTRPARATRCWSPSGVLNLPGEPTRIAGQMG